MNGGGGITSSTGSSGQKIDTTIINNPKPVIKNIAPHTNVAHRCLSHTPSSPMSDTSTTENVYDGDNINETPHLSSSNLPSSHQVSGNVVRSKVQIMGSDNYVSPGVLPLDSSKKKDQANMKSNTSAEKVPPILDYPLKPVKPLKDPALAPLDESEITCRRKAESRGSVLFMSNSTSALIVFFACIFSYESLLSVALSVGMTCYVYFVTLPQGGISWSMDWTLLGFAVVTPMSISIGLAFQRRELALKQIATFRASCFQIYLAHTTWDWGSNQISGRQKASQKVNWLDHSDDVLRELIGMADELCRFLTLPSFSRARHRVTPWGRREASRTVEVAYRLWDSLLTTRMSKLTYLVEILKKYGMPGNETARIRQWERFVGEAIEQLRILKTYRTPQALRSFARLFTIILPGFYSPDFAQLAQESNSLGLGLTFAVLTSFALSALFESIYMLEDPFVAHLSLDGIDVHEELRVLHWHQLINTRQIFFPNASPYVDKFSSEFIMSPKISKTKKPSNNEGNRNNGRHSTTSKDQTQKAVPNNKSDSIENDDNDDDNNPDVKITMDHSPKNEVIDSSATMKEPTKSSSQRIKKKNNDNTTTGIGMVMMSPTSSTRNTSSMQLDRDEPNPNSNTPSMTRESSYAHFRQSSLTSPINYQNGEKGT